MKITKKINNYNFGYIKVKPSSNNIFITLTDAQGNVLLSKHAGLLNFKGSKKKTPFVASQVVRNLIEEAKALIKKYSEQQKNVRNNREYNSLSKEIEFQELEIQLTEKHIKEYKVQIEQKKEVILETKERLKDRTAHLKHKKGELNEILKETEKEEKALIEKSEEFQKKLDERLVNAYLRIRNNVKNGLAVVPIERGASGGSFFTIPPQVQVEIASRKKVITDEHSGRILVDAQLAEEEKVKMKKLFTKLNK